MQYHCVIAALLGLAITSHAAPGVLLEEAKGLPAGWSFQRGAKASDTITLFVALKEPGIEALKASLHERQTPGHPSFGRHLTRDEVVRMRQPADSTAKAVAAWLAAAGIRDVTNQGSLLSFEASARAVKTLFKADLGYYAYNNTGEVDAESSEDGPPPSLLRAPNYTIPYWLQAYIDFVHPLSSFTPPRPRRGHRRRPKPHPTRPHPHPGKPTTKSSSSRASPSSIPSTLKTSTSISTSSTSSLTPDATLSLTPDPVISLSSLTPDSTTSLTPDPTTDPTDPSVIFPNLPCLAATVPSCIKKLYNLTYSPPSHPPSPVRLGVAGFLEQYILHSDVSSFLDTFTPTLPESYNFTIELINNGTNPQDSPHHAGMEASLDVQYAMALGHPAQVTYYVTGGRGTKLDSVTGLPLGEGQGDNEPFLEFLEALLKKSDDEIPHVLSVSYADDEVSVPREYAVRVCDMFAALAARGVTVLAATGDGGAAGTAQTRCVVPGTGGEGRRFVTTFPASCPWVTAVGATDNVAPPVAGAVFSAGGFSDFFERPAWQEGAVKGYVDGLVKSNDSRVGLFNMTGRAVPDISAIGSGFQIIIGGTDSRVLGTSASTPVIAAMIALINDARMRAGKSSIGWLNPLLYSNKVKRVLHDVTVGESAGCRFYDGLTSLGWTAVEGYDCVTGLGVVDDFAHFMAALM